MNHFEILQAISAKFPEADLSNPEFYSSPDSPEVVYVKPAEPIANGSIYVTFLVDVKGVNRGRVLRFRSLRRPDGTGDDTLP